MSKSVNYPASYDIIYRIGYVIQFIGIIWFLGAYMAQNPLSVWGILLFQGGVLLSASFLLVWNKAVKQFILASTIGGMTVEGLAYYAFEGPDFSLLFLFGAGLVFVGAAGLVGKEAYCFHFNAGWGLLGLYPLLVLANFIAPQARLLLTGLYSLGAVLFLAFLYRKLTQPLIHHCSRD